MSENKNVIEAQIVDGEIKMADMPQKPTTWQKVKSGIKKNWWKVLIGGLSLGATGTGAYALGKRQGKKMATMATVNVNTTDEEFLMEGKNIDEFPEV